MIKIEIRMPNYFLEQLNNEFGVVSLDAYRNVNTESLRFVLRWSDGMTVEKYLSELAIFSANVPDYVFISKFIIDMAEEGLKQSAESA